jgi:hypothetical protein
MNCRFCEAKHLIRAGKVGKMPQWRCVFCGHDHLGKNAEILVHDQNCCPDFGRFKVSAKSFAGSDNKQ